MPPKTIRYARGLKMPLTAATAKFVFVGRSGSGKTYAAGKLAECFYDVNIQFIALDDIGNWHGLRTGAGGKGKGLDILIFGGEHGDIPITPESGALVAQVLVKHGLSAVIDISDFRKNQAKRFATDFAEEFFHLKKTNKSPVHLFIEEAHTFIPEHTSKGTERMKGAFQDIARKGRNYGIGWTIITQSPQSVDKRCLNQADPIVIYQTAGDHELQAIGRWVKHKRRPELQQAMDEIPELAVGDGFLWSPQFLRTFRKFRCLPKRTYDASATPELGEEVTPPKPMRKADLKQLRLQMAELVTEVEKEDPAALQRQVAKLKHQDQENEKTIAALAERIEQLLARPVPKAKAERLLSKADITRLEKAARALTGFSDRIDALVKDAGKVSVLVRADADTIRTLTREKPWIRPPEPGPARKPFTPIKVKGKPLSQEIIDARGPRDHASADNGKLGGAERKILRALKQIVLLGREPTRSLTGHLAGYTPKGSSMRNGLSALRREGFILRGTLEITPEGMEAAGDVEAPTSAGIIEFWRNQVGGPERKLFDYIVECYPNVADREAMAEATGYEPGGSSIRNGLSVLRKLQLVTSRSEPLKAREHLFVDR